ncbi:flagellar protein export ATPase FliI [Garciella nitratireducens]|uniref:flagellar protein export ATPase FliI n=1 Tax=Garciella nitratireducens TaxID=218205 RepID=UPI003B5A2CB7
MNYSFPFKTYKEYIERNQFYSTLGKVVQVIGLTIVVTGIKSFVGEVCEILLEEKEKNVLAEVVGFKNHQVLLMPLGELNGVAPGCKVRPTSKALTIQVGEELLGKVLDGLGRPMEDDVCSLKRKYSVQASPPNPLKRKRITKIMPTGVRAIDGLLTCGEGQRVGIFAGSGVGKSTLLGMISRYCEADINIIALIGERGREVLDFIEKDLGKEGLKKSVVVCATSDQPALVRLKGAYVATSIAEYFRDQGKKVMLMMDSVTRFAMAKREVGLAIGEPPATKGYTPSVFAELPRLLERSGTSDKGSITAFYTVLVDGDDMNEPIADAVRGILDGHIVLSRRLAGQNHFPAIDIGASISRLAKEIIPAEQDEYSGQMRDILATYEKSEDLINIGAYTKGSNAEIDRALELYQPIKNFLKQGVNEKVDYDTTLEQMKKIFR